MSASKYRFSAAIVKGLAEKNDPKCFFGSLLGFKWHLEEAERIGVIERTDEDSPPTLTNRGKAWAEKLSGPETARDRASSWDLDKIDGPPGVREGR